MASSALTPSQGLAISRLLISIMLYPNTCHLDFNVPPAWLALPLNSTNTSCAAIIWPYWRSAALYLLLVSKNVSLKEYYSTCQGWSIRQTSTLSWKARFLSMTILPMKRSFIFFFVSAATGLFFAFIVTFSGCAKEDNLAGCNLLLQKCFGSNGTSNTTDCNQVMSTCLTQARHQKLFVLSHQSNTLYI